MRIETRIAEYIGAQIAQSSEHLNQAREKAEDFLRQTRIHRMNESRKALQLIDCGLLRAQV